MSDWVAIYRTTDNFKAELAKQVLTNAGIESVILNQQDSSYNFGEIKVNVNRDNVIRAKSLLKELED